MGVENSTSNLRYLAFSLSETGSPKVSLKSTELKYTRELPVGFAGIETLQAGSCQSELFYYLRRSDDQPSRFEQDSKDETKQAYYIKRNMQVGINPELKNIETLKDLIEHSMFHEGFGRITQAHPEIVREKIPVQVYLPKKDKLGSIGFVKEVIETNFQENLEEGKLAVRNPAYICDKHSHADNINLNTGWPYQCHRENEEGHIPKGTIGHAEFIGAAVEGNIRVPLNALTPLPANLQQFVEQDIEKRACLLTAIEPLGCVFNAFGTLLQSKEIPGSIVVIGDGPNALNIVAFCQVFAPDAHIVVLGKNKAKLESFTKINPTTVTTAITDGKNFDDLDVTLLKLLGRSQADVVIPTVSLHEDLVSHFVRDNGTLIWWASNIMETVNIKSKRKRYRERFPYGGAPRAEFSAAALMEYFVRERPDIIETFLTFPGIYYTAMNKNAAFDIQEWLENKGRLVRTVLTSNGLEKLSVKPIINTTSLNQTASR